MTELEYQIIEALTHLPTQTFSASNGIIFRFENGVGTVSHKELEWIPMRFFEQAVTELLPHYK